MTKTQPRDGKGRFARTYGFAGTARELKHTPPPTPPIPLVLRPFDPATFDMTQHLEGWHGPDAADRYRRLVAGKWELPTGTLTKEQQLEVEIMAVAAQYDLAVRTGRDPFAVLMRIDQDGFNDGQYAGYDKRGRAVFGRREEIARLEAAVSPRREYGPDGVHVRTGTLFSDKVPPTDVLAFLPEDENGVSYNLLTNSVFSPPPNPRMRDGWRLKDGKRRRGDGTWERHPTFPHPYWPHARA